MKSIQLTNGDLAIVDDEDYWMVRDYEWNVAHIRNYTYAVAHLYHDGGIEMLYMHRVIMGFSKGDPNLKHLDGDGLNNRRYNIALLKGSKKACRVHPRTDS